MPEDIHWQKYAARFRTFPALLKPGTSAPGMVVCIPVYAEPDLLTTLESLLACDLPDTEVEVILLFNKSDRMTRDEIAQHDLTWVQTVTWIETHQRDRLFFLPVYLDSCPDPKGGVGWARKLVMDEAARRMDQEGVLLCLDGDCTVDKNYLQVVYDYFQQHPSCHAASIYFEHRLDHLGTEERQAIVQYELHLRYLVQVMRWAGHPFAFHTVGSAMAVRRKPYLMQGGMNTRQAGEDFYFLQKFIEIESLHEIRQTTVYPSARVSGRVPFGTGRAMQSLLVSSAEWKTTDFEVFHLIKPLLVGTDKIRQIWRDPGEGDKQERLMRELDLHHWVNSFLVHIGFADQCRLISAQTSNMNAFRRRFFRYFNSFMMIRYMHYISQHFIPESGVSRAATVLLNEVNALQVVYTNTEELLAHYRHMEKYSGAT